MAEQIVTLVKIPLAEIEKWIRTKYVLPSVLTDSRLEENNLVLCFSEKEVYQNKPEPEQQLPKTQTKQRRARRKRNRMRTRGWEIVARITNTKGQNCAIYKPFVDALQDAKLTSEEQKKKVESILKSNRNKPSESSTEYFLENTLEYLRDKKDQTHIGEAT